jgi:hypothetical protein
MFSKTDITVLLGEQNALPAGLRDGGVYSACWKSIRTKLRADSEFWKAFLAILNALCARDDALALGICSEATRGID